MRPADQRRITHGRRYHLHGRLVGFPVFFALLFSSVDLFFVRPVDQRRRITHMAGFGFGFAVRLYGSYTTHQSHLPDTEVPQPFEARRTGHMGDRVHE